MTVEEWRDEYDLVETPQLGCALDDQWQLRYTADQWREVLGPADRNTLRGVCEFIAAGASSCRIQPATVLGRRCPEAGAFFAVRSRLEDARFDVQKLRPSTRVGDCARPMPGEFVEVISRLAPGALTQMELVTPGEDFWCTVYGVCLLAAFAGFVAGSFWPWLTPPAFGILLLCLVAGWAAHRQMEKPPRDVLFGEVETLGDLARRIAALHVW
ncbi:MAG: hypothetical protein ACLFV7_06985 [Phycisphaerae bacterium]